MNRRPITQTRRESIGTVAGRPFAALRAQPGKPHPMRKRIVQTRLPRGTEFVFALSIWTIALAVYRMV